jgi:calcineurin-like phosphoesterase family protein
VGNEIVSNVFFIGDLHFGHKNIHTFRSELGFDNEEEHREFLIEQWNSVVNKRSVIWVLGDAVFSSEHLCHIDRLLGTKFLILGNHDLGAKEMLSSFDKVHGFQKYKGFWLSHCPIHPEELRGKPNIHGHVHSNTIQDKRYFNASCENIDYKPVSIEEVRQQTGGFDG